MAKKIVIEIDTCYDCPTREQFGSDNYCRDTGRLLKNPVLSIPDNCPIGKTEKEKKS